MNYYELKELRNSLTTVTKTQTNTIPILLTYSVYSDAGPDYKQRIRFAKPEDLDKLKLIKCIRCNQLMDGGRYRNDSKKQMCYSCHRETTLEEIFNALDTREGKPPTYNVNYDW